MGIRVFYQMVLAGRHFCTVLSCPCCVRIPSGRRRLVGIRAAGEACLPTATYHLHRAPGRLGKAFELPTTCSCSLAAAGGGRLFCRRRRQAHHRRPAGDTGLYIHTAADIIVFFLYLAIERTACAAICCRVVMLLSTVFFSVRGGRLFFFFVRAVPSSGCTCRRL